MRRGSCSSAVSSSRITILVIVLRVVASHSSHSRGVCGRSTSGRSASPADRAATVLGCEKPPAGLVDRQGRLAPPFGPVLGEGGVVRGRSAFDHLVSNDAGPGELVHVGAALAVAEHPPVTPGLVEPGVVPSNDPAGRLVRVAGPGPLECELPQVAVQRAEYLAGDLCPVVGGPPPDDRVELLDHRGCVGPAQGPQLGAPPFPDPSDG